MDIQEFKIPENCRVIIEPNAIIFEPIVPQFKKGDFLWNDKYDCGFIFSHLNNDGSAME